MEGLGCKQHHSAVGCGWFDGHPIHVEDIDGGEALSTSDEEATLMNPILGPRAGEYLVLIPFVRTQEQALTLARRVPWTQWYECT
jgi:hypothetical protein